LPAGIKVTLPRDLASDEVRVEIIAHGSEEMALVLASLAAKASELVRLAAMLSGVDRGCEVE
jgi:virulence-associated protein VagC